MRGGGTGSDAIARPPIARVPRAIRGPGTPWVPRGYDEAAMRGPEPFRCPLSHRLDTPQSMQGRFRTVRSPRPVLPCRRPDWSVHRRFEGAQVSASTAEQVTAALAAARALTPDVLDLTARIAAIPAPTGAEAVRGRFV